MVRPFRAVTGAASVLLACLICFITGVATGQSLTPPPQASGYRLAFQDNFRALDLSKDQSGNHTWYPNVFFEHNRPPLENIEASDSGLSLTWRSTQGSSDTSIETSSPTGKYSHAWKYGYFEVRMKWQAVPGAWPALWMIPVESAQGVDFYNGQHDSGEVDIFEGQGDHPSTFYGTIHHWIGGKQVESSGDGPPRNAFGLSYRNDFSQYHTYGLLWEPGKMTWFYDDKPLHSEKTYPVFDRRRYMLILAMQEGAKWVAGDRSGVSANAMTMKVDWVRVWQK